MHLAQLLRIELTQRPVASELYVDSIITLFGIHLLRNYSEAVGSLRPVRGVLSVRNRDRIREFLAENFTNKLSVADLAIVCELSPRHAGSNAFQSEIQQIKDRTNALNAMTQAQAGVNPLVNDYGFAVKFHGVGPSRLQGGL